MLNSHPFLYEQEEEEVVPIIDFIELSSNLTERNYTQTQTRSDAQLESNMLNFTEEDARFPCFIDEKSLFYSSVLSKKGGGITNAKLTAHIHTILQKKEKAKQILSKLKDIDLSSIHSARNAPNQRKFTKSKDHKWIMQYNVGKQIQKQLTNKINRKKSSIRLLKDIQEEMYSPGSGLFHNLYQRLHAFSYDHSKPSCQNPQTNIPRIHKQDRQNNKKAGIYSRKPVKWMTFSNLKELDTSQRSQSSQNEQNLNNIQIQTTHSKVKS